MADFMNAFNGLSCRTEGEMLCLTTYEWLYGLEPGPFESVAKTALGGALIFIANQYANENNLPVLYLGMYDGENHV